jgi:hypothetical protein
MKYLAHVTVLLCGIAAAQAQGTYEALLNYSNATPGTLSSTAGWSFTPQINIQVTHLGCLDYVFTSQGPIDIGLWTDSGTLLAQSQVFSTNTLVNSTHYVALVNPIVLLGGSTYRVGAFSPGGMLIDAVGPGFGGGATLSSDIGLGGLAVSSSTGSFTFPDSKGASGTMLEAPNFRYDRIPEPATSTLLALSAVLVAFRRQRQR